MLKCRAFTIIELLVVVALVSVLAAILYPVFARAKVAAIQSNCIERFHQVSLAGHLYTTDYDDTFMPVNHQPGGPANAATDTTWVQMMLPYTGNFRTFRCPADNTDIESSDATFDQDLIPNDLYSRYYTASMHVNLGYNFQYLAPIVKENGTWLAEPTNTDSIIDPSRMLYFIDSVWEVQNNVPSGGGSWLVSPPCRYQQVGDRQVDTITLSVRDLSAPRRGGIPEIFAPTVGWAPLQDEAGAVYGGAWPWHQGRLSIATIDGSVRAITVAQLGSGCDIRPAWTGTIQDRHNYLWSPQ